MKSEFIFESMFLLFSAPSGQSAGGGAIDGIAGGAAGKQGLKGEEEEEEEEENINTDLMFVFISVQTGDSSSADSLGNFSTLQFIKHCLCQDT